MQSLDILIGWEGWGTQFSLSQEVNKDSTLGKDMEAWLKDWDCGGITNILSNLVWNDIRDCVIVTSTIKEKVTWKELYFIIIMI